MPPGGGRPATSALQSRSSQGVCSQRKGGACQAPPGLGRRAAPPQVPHAHSLCTALGGLSTAATAICRPRRWTWPGSEAHRPTPDALSSRTRVLALLLLSRQQADLGSPEQGPQGFEGKEGPLLSPGCSGAPRTAGASQGAGLCVCWPRGAGPPCPTRLSGLQSVYERQGIAVMTPTVPGSPKGPFLGLPRGTMRRQKSIGKQNSHAHKGGPGPSAGPLGDPTPAHWKHPREPQTL